MHVKSDIAVGLDLTLLLIAAVPTASAVILDAAIYIKSIRKRKGSIRLPTKETWLQPQYTQNKQLKTYIR